MNIAIIIPTYNERENIVTLLEGLQDSVGQFRRMHISYIVVDDNSPDGTAKKVESYRQRNKNVYIITGKKEGLGRALLRGMTYAVDILHVDYIVQMDADLSHNPKHLPDFIRALEGGADFVVGSRYIPGGSIPENWGIHRKIYSVLGNAIVRYGLGYLSVHDWTGGYRAYKKIYYEKAKDEMRKYTGYVFQIAFLHKAIKRGAHIEEVPIQFTDRQFGHSKIATSEYMKNVFQYVARERAKSIIHGNFGKFLVVGSVGFIINTILLVALVHLGLHPSIGSAIGAEIAIISNFVLNNAWTFSERRIHGIKKLLKFLQFNLTSCGAILIQAGVVWIGVHVFGRAVYFYFYIVGVGIGLLWNYTMYSKVIWKKHIPTQ